MTQIAKIHPKPVGRPFAMTGSMTTLVRKLTDFVRPEGGDRWSISSRAEPTKTERAALVERRAVLVEAIQANGPDPIKARLHALVGTLPAPTTDTGNPDMTIMLYQAALADLPAWAVIDAIDAVFRGRIGSNGGRFRPSPGEIHVYAEKLVAALIREKLEIEKILNARVESAEGERVPRGDISAVVKRTVAALKAARPRNECGRYAEHVKESVKPKTLEEAAAEYASTPVTLSPDLAAKCRAATRSIDSDDDLRAALR